MKFQDLHNIMLCTDSYKATHHGMLPDGLEYASSYGEARGGDYPYTVFYGIKYPIVSYLSGVQVTEEKIQEAKTFYNAHFGNDNAFNEEGWRYILNECGGKLPLLIESVDEGSVIPVKNVLFKISNTDKNCAWLVNWVETILMKIWYPITIASNSLLCEEILKHFQNISGTDPKGDVSFKLHDFGYRGVASEEQAWLGGSAHALFFNGSDTIGGLRMLMKYYDAPMPAFSVNASEHMVMSIRGKENERQTYVEILQKYPTGKLSLVSDTYDIYAVCKMLAEDEEIRGMIDARAPGDTFVIRPDSGEPIEVLNKCLDLLADGFGYTTNESGFKVINDKVRILQGDGIDSSSLYNILNVLVTQYKWSLDNLIFGSGGGLLQKFNRDTIKFAIKCSHAIINGKSIDVYKDPITSKGSKKSKMGEQYLVLDKRGYSSLNVGNIQLLETGTYKEMLKPIFKNGEYLGDATYDSIRNNITEGLKIVEYIESKKDANNE